jgi:hypothetical protein
VAAHREGCEAVVSDALPDRLVTSFKPCPLPASMDQTRGRREIGVDPFSETHQWDAYTA